MRDCRKLELMALGVRLEGISILKSQNILNDIHLPVTSGIDLKDVVKKAVASKAKLFFFLIFFFLSNPWRIEVSIPRKRDSSHY